jgi:4'-phosphopantetheinyl transferase
LVAHVATRFVLSHYGPTTPGEWGYERGANGRPEIVDGPAGLRFNISHTEGMAAVLVHGEHDAGVDVESPWRSTNFTSVSRRVFTEAERSAMLALPEEQQAGRFFQLWTLKESFIKAKGKGFAMPLSKFGFTIADDDTIGFSCDPSLDPDASAWGYSTAWSETGHVVSVCAHAPDRAFVEPTLRSLDVSL